MKVLLLENSYAYKKKKTLEPLLCHINCYYTSVI